jgi:hypothetical protein
MNENNKKQLIFENENNFDILLIKPCSIEHLNWSDPNYVEQLLKLDCYTIINTNSENFIDCLTESLELIKHKDKPNLEVKTQVICDCPNYLFEILYIENLTESEDTLNEVGTLINTNGEKLYGNILFLKTYLPSLSKSMVLDNASLPDIHFILDNRANTKIVIYDDEWSNVIVRGNMDDYAKTFFDEPYVKCEIAFLLYNINIWYETCDGCSTKICGNILNKPIYKCLWFTMLTDEYRGSITLEEVQKIISVSKQMDLPFTAKNEWIEDEKDQYKRDVVKNKYRVLDMAYNELCIKK